MLNKVFRKFKAESKTVISAVLALVMIVGMSVIPGSFSATAVYDDAVEKFINDNSNSKYTVGDDISLSSEESYNSTCSLKYSYNYAVKYFETSNNTAGLGKVEDNTTYKISFYYKLTEAQGDVDIKFLTAHLKNRWSFITDYNEATYTVYSGEIGNNWKKATVYLTTKFASIGTSGLFMTFNPVIEGATVLYIDAVSVESVDSGKAVAAFLDEEGTASIYVVGNVGATVAAPAGIPAAQFAAFDGWYFDKECTAKFTSATLSEGIKYIYSDWLDNTERFDNYTYASNDTASFGKGMAVADGVLTYTAAENNQTIENGFRLGKVYNNTSYKVTFEYKTTVAGTQVHFASANEMDINVNTTAYLDDGMYYTVSEENADGNWHTATVYLTTAFAYTVPKDKDVNKAENSKAKYGDMLYAYFKAEQSTAISVDNISLKEVEVLSQNGASVLKEEESQEAGHQALRFYFGYPTEDFVRIDIDGETMTLVERGIIFKNARNTATGTDNGDSITVNAITIDSKNLDGHTAVSKTYEFNKYWEYDNKTQSVVFSGYVKNFDFKDSRLMGARGYIKVKDELGNIYTFYSADKKTTVKEGVEINSEITNVDVHTFAGVTFDNYTIVNPKLMPYIYGRQIEFLIEYAKDTHGVDLKRVTEKAAETDYEIVIGNTNRDASDLVTVENKDEYVIAVKGTKVIIKGGNDLATMQGVKDFIEYLKLKDSLDCGADLKDGYTKIGKISATADDYALTFVDEFDAATINTQVWGAYANQDKKNGYKVDSSLGGYMHIYSVDEGGYTTAGGKAVPNAIFTSNGNAVLTTARINNKDFIQSQMSTFWNMIYQYGMLEIKCKLSAPPSFACLWVNGSSTGSPNFTNRFGREARGCMSEYDLLENYGRRDYFASCLHYWWNSTGAQDTGHLSVSPTLGMGGQTYTPDSDETSMYDNYHILTYLWENDRLIFAIDGVKYCEYINSPSYYDRMPNYIILGLGLADKEYVGSIYDPDLHEDYYETLIDYVKIYQNQNMGSILRYAYR